MELTDVATEELERLGEALAMLYELWDVTKANIKCKEHAITDLWDELDRAKFPKLAKPYLFVAYGHRADERVRAIIDETLQQFKDKLEFTDWSRMTKSGNISFQISVEILRSRFGICYFSEPIDPGGDPESKCFDDNRNVVFEAGMLHARTTAASDGGGRDRQEGQPCGWIPVREESSPSAPFDFAADRMLIVPRSRGVLLEQEFRNTLTERIRSLLSET
jgi:hypothetical protein